MFCESCADGTDLRPGGKCNVCNTDREIVDVRQCEFPMTEDDVLRNIPITKIIEG